MSLLSFVTLDTETTGFSSRDEILSCGVVDPDGNPLIDTLVQTQFKRSWFHAEQVHGISPADVALNGISYDRLLEQLAEKIQPFESIVIYNAQFDLRFFPDSFFKNHRVICAMKHSVRFLAEHPFREAIPKAVKQAALAELLQIQTDDLSLHSSKDDAELCRRIWRQILDESQRYGIRIY